MGGGNACKSKNARERKVAQGSAGGKSQLKQNAAAQTIVCSVCKQSFMCTTNAAQLEQHATSKHPKSTPKECFPDKL
ncbi:putative Zinc-binding [Blattamonas nauphoetae]|uniref:Zinc-binding n=1 Tax=Blattamonas nauphoetae TaxID=2049346 RepID=A0ABQ9XWM3_9EUKA|nr:putative Zinc-binding [Blattamonas nauphoetae]